ncbi:MAG: RNA polymerase sigma factor [Verrucomicrobiota bacterium]
MNPSDSASPPAGASETYAAGSARVASAANADWFAKEVHAHDGRLKAYLRGVFPGVHDVDDLVQESYVRVWLRQTRQPIASVRAFLFKVARHLALNSLRHQNASPFIAVTETAVSRVVEDRPSPADQACTDEELTLLFEAIDALPARCREVYILRKLKGLSQKEIAAKLGISEQTVETQVVRANHRCEAFLRARGVLRT